MLSIYNLKPAFQQRLRPINKWLFQRGVTPNQVTLLAMALSFVAGGFIALFPEHHWPLLLIPVVLFVRMALNAIDGMLAREYKMESPLGAVLNELGDVLSDVFLYLPLALIASLEAHWVILVVILAIISEMAGVVAIQIGAERRYDGPMGKSDRAVVLGGISLLLGCGYTGNGLNIVLLISVVLLCMTIVNRVRHALIIVSQK